MNRAHPPARPLIGIVGGYGAVGRSVVAHLGGSGRVRLRVGGRDGDRAADLVGEIGDAAEAMTVDAYDPESLARFCAGCSVVVHSGGASYQVQDRVAVAASLAGADYVDSGGDLPLLRQIQARDMPAGCRALVTAGMMPGLSGLLPRWLAGAGFERIDALTGYIGIVDQLSPAGAIDYLLSLGERDSESQAAWIGGRKVMRALSPQADIALPYFPGRVSMFPYLSYEAERFALQMAVPEVRWYSVFDQGGNMVAALGRLQAAMTGQSDLAEAGLELRLAADLDLVGRQPYQLMVFEATGTDAETATERTRTLMVRSRSASALTGTVCALSVLSVLDGCVPYGANLAAESLDPDRIVRALRDAGAFTSFTLRDGPYVQENDLVDEGAL
jgi:hypothetical protein